MISEVGTFSLLEGLVMFSCITSHLLSLKPLCWVIMVLCSGDIGVEADNEILLIELMEELLF